MKLMFIPAYLIEKRIEGNAGHTEPYQCEQYNIREFHLMFGKAEILL